MKILLIEDEQPAARRLSTLLNKLYPDAEVLGPLESIEETLEHLQTHGEPDLYLMDIQLADGNSFEIFEHFTVKNPVIFITAFDEFAIKAFDVNSISYLLKPLEEEALEKALQKWQTANRVESPNMLELLEKLRPKTFKQRFLLKKGERYIPVGADDIAYFQASGKLVLLYTHDKQNYLVDQTLDALEKELDPAAFFRLNRGFIVSIKSIEEVSHSFNGKLKVKLSPAPNEENVSVSRDKASQFKAWVAS